MDFINWLINFLFPHRKAVAYDNQKMIQIESGCVKPFGLPNIGNTCFMNSSLQCLLSLPGLIENIDNLISHSKNPNLLYLLQSLAIKQDNSVSSKIKQKVASKNEVFYGFSQQDSYEFTISLIELLIDENEKGVSDLFVGAYKSISECRNCFSKTSIKQAFSSINLSIKETFRVNYVPYLLTQNIIRMPQKPVVSEVIKTQKRFSKKITINPYVFVAKMNKKYEIINQISAEQPQIYAFELPDEVQEGNGLIIIQLKTDDKRPISSPFLCEVPVNGFDVNQLREVVYSRLTDVNKGTFTKSSITFSKTFEKFTFSEQYPLLKEHLTIIVNDPDSFDFEKRSEINQNVDLNLIELFNCHVRQNQLEPPCKWTCDECGKRTRAYQRNKYTQFPEILIFQVKRSSDMNPLNATPDQTRVSFPKEVSFKIDDDDGFDQISLDKIGGLRYELRSIAHHSGSFRGGHYWAWGKRGQDWFMLNDNSTPTLIDNPCEPTSSAYVAFYEKVPLEPRKTILVSAPHIPNPNDTNECWIKIGCVTLVVIGLTLLSNIIQKK